MNSFAAKLIGWQKQHGRHHLPWQNTRDPYAIWLSEIMLQQTQVSTVIPYYRRFLQRFPDINSLALASLDDVLAQWSGLGYYSRGRNLHRAARLIVANHQGIFPRDVEAIRQLPGIGRSTAAAIAAFAYGERCAILDGNVKRIFVRYFGIEGYPGEKWNEILLWQKAEELLPPRDADQNQINGRIEAYTQALMDLGATVCTRGKPKCASCPVQSDCIALRDSRTDKLPTPRLRKSLPEKETVLLVLMKQNMILLEKRPATGIWGGLWCLPEMPVSKNAVEYCMQNFGMKVKPPAQMQPFDHTFTHFKLRIYPQSLQVVSCSVATGSKGQDRGESIWMTADDALKAAIPSPVRKLLIQHGCPQIMPLSQKKRTAT
ncbi:A/G-specific adenine glycosylase [Nitrosovibrio sp. Nv4]|uniref:A/G-specific adenine glycosylase n=1 Tax=Nitrosovibrio sp. Nv4 TaxID=1945880 RepID=UPI000BC8DA51|nr:A/G-specific adenine glycosylase [Nitrosovibrio sp. Nv4]SOD40211.1 A/G-specific DNA-adenine glycosylase [Nitrosovibrio sp. Nv4]